MRYDLLVGADGAGSGVRSQLARIMPPGFCQRFRTDIVQTSGPAELEEGEESSQRHTFFERHDFSVCILLACWHTGMQLALQLLARHL